MEVIFDNVTKKYHYEVYPTLDNLSFRLDGSVSTLLLENQSGKTTIAKILLGIEKYQGKVIFNGQPLENVDIEKRNLLYLREEPIFFENRTVYYNLAYTLKIRQIDKEQIKKIIDENVKQYGINKDEKVKKLDKEKRFLLSLIRAKNRKVDVILCDDLSENNVIKTMDFFTEQKPSFILLTSNVDASKGKIHVIKDHKEIFCGEKEEIKLQMKDLFWLNVTK